MFYLKNFVTQVNFLIVPKNLKVISPESKFSLR